MQMKRFGLFVIVLLVLWLFAVPLMDFSPTFGSSSSNISVVQYLTYSGAPPTQWSRTYNYARVSGDSATSVVQTSDGGYAIAGNIYAGLIPCLAWLVKTDSSGSPLWNRTYKVAGESYGEVYSVVQTSDGGYALAGRVYLPRKSYDLWLVKTDRFGNLLWNKTFGDVGDDFGSSLVQTSDGGYAVAGTGYSDPYYDPYNGVWLVKTDSFGNHQWDTMLRTTGIRDYVYSLIETRDGGYAIAGATEFRGTPKSNTNALLVKLDSSGVLLWRQTYDWTDIDRARSVFQTRDGGFALAGYTYSLSAFVSDVLLVKTDPFGTLEWSQTYGGASDDYASSVVQASDEGYVVAGSTESYGFGSSDIWLFKTDSSGIMEWNRTYGGASWDEASSMVQTRDEGYAIAGTTTTSDTAFDFWLIKVGFEDTDGDGLLDQWEREGIDINEDGIIDLDLPALGANPLHKDLFLEIDYMGSDGTHDHKPDDDAIDDVIFAFRNAPVENPDKRDGINLHIDIDEEIYHRDFLCVWNEFDDIKSARFGTEAQRNNPNSDYILIAKSLVYRYALFIHQFAEWNETLGAWEISGETGIAERGGNDFIVSLGTFTNKRGSRDEQAGTLMHELGHTLGLMHGGGDLINGKPNYLSVMSYSRMFSIYVPNRRLDYSREKLPTLDEDRLNETLGIRGSPGDITVFGPLRYKPETRQWIVGGGFSQGPIDWNLNESIDSELVSRNINDFTAHGFGDKIYGTLEGYDDWANIQYVFRFTGDFARGVHNNVPDDEITWEMVQQMRNTTIIRFSFPYDVTINAYCSTEAAELSVEIAMDGTPTGYNTSHTFTDLRDTHTFTVPSADANGHPFLKWSTGETNTTINVIAGGTFTAFYEATPPPTPRIWTIETVDTRRVPYTFDQNSISIALDSDDNPHIAYGSTYGLIYAKRTGGRWVFEYLGNYTAWDVSLALDSSNNPHIVLDDINEGFVYTHKTEDSWITESVIGESGTASGDYLSFALDSNGTPHISYRGGGADMDNLMYAKRTGGYWRWTIETVDVHAQEPLETSIALDSSNNPHISYVASYNFELRYAKKNIDGTWTIEIVGKTGTAQANFYTSIALDSGDNTHISYQGRYLGLMYAKKIGGSWSIETTADSTSVALYISMALDSLNNPHISYINGTFRGYGNFHLMYAKKIGGTWTIETVDSPSVPGSVLIFTSLAIDSSDNTHISYYDFSKKELKYAFFGPPLPPTYDVTISAYSNTKAANVSVAIYLDGIPSGYNTPYTFQGLTGTHTFTIPNAEENGQPFKQWNTGQTDTTITVNSTGTYTAYYEGHPPPPPNLIWSSDFLGVPKDVFPPSETVYVTVTATGKNVTLYVVVDQTTWKDGDPLVDVSDGAETLTLNPSPGTQTIQIWAQTPTAGNYDIIMDVNNNGVYDAGTDLIDSELLTGFVVTASPLSQLPTTIWSSDNLGNPKDFFATDETVYVTVTATGQQVTLYIVADKTVWNNCDILNDVSDGAETLTLDSRGNQTIQIWASPLAEGIYDIVMDVNNNGIYDAGLDLIDSELVAGFIVPEITLHNAIVVLAIVISNSLILIAKLKRSRKLQTQE